MNRKRHARLGLPAVLAMCLASTLASAADKLADVTPADVDRGEALYENHCRECHDQRAFTREQRLAGNLQELKAWVSAWSVHADLGWDGDAVRDVTEFLNQRFYGYHD